jgi:hypothetical protein
MVCMVPQPFAAGRTQSYPEFWVVTGGPRYPGYFIPIVTPEPSVEWAVKNVLSMGGGIGVHMLLRALPRDSMARLWG